MVAEVKGIHGAPQLPSKSFADTSVVLLGAKEAMEDDYGCDRRVMNPIGGLVMCVGQAQTTLLDWSFRT